MKLKEIAAGISKHLERFEQDKSINTIKNSRSLPPYYRAYAGACGAYVRVTYVSFQGSSCLNKAAAVRYLSWLDAGNIGKHWKALESSEST